MNYRFRVLLVTIAAVVLAALAGYLTSFQQAAGTPQASITLTNCDAQFCYTHDNKWTLTKEVTGNTVTGGKGTVTWTVTATKDTSAAATFTVHGGLTVTNTGTAPATIGNIVVNLQKPNSPKQGSNAPYVSVAAAVADATNGDAATSANIVAGGSQENQTTNALWGTNNYTVSGAKGTFTETAGSGSLEFTDASNNTIFSLVPQPEIPVGGSVTLLYSASFNTSILVPGTAYRAEALVTFGNAGARGGSGATASNIDINGNGTTDADEANVRTVPCRHTLDPLPASPDECNSSVTVTDPVSGVTTSGTVSATNPVGFDQFPATISATTSWNVSVDVDSGTDGGSVCNAADLNGEACGGTLNVIIGYGDIDPATGLPTPIYATFVCAPAAEDSASSCVQIVPGAGDGGCLTKFCDGQYCIYGKGAYAGSGDPGKLFDANYQTIFSGGLDIGISDGAGPRHDASWTANATGQSALKSYLTSPAGGANSALTADTVNATSTSGGDLPRQTAALALNIGFNGAGLSGTETNFGSLTLCGLTAGSTIGGWTLTAAQAAALNGTSISQVLIDANNALGGNGLPSYVGSFGDLNQLVTALNESFDSCAVSDFATAHLCKP